MKTKTTFQKSCLVILFFLGIAMQSLKAQTPLFSQNFNSSSTLATYINSSSPSNGQFNAISTSSGTTATITSSALQFVRTGGTGSFSRSSNLSPVPSGIIYKFDLNVTASSQTGSVARWQVGSGFSTSNSNESSGDCYAQFAIDFRNGNNFRINDITNGNTFSNYSGGTSRTITWVLNNSGSTLSYNAPDGTVKTVSDNRTDLWVGTTRIISGDNVEDNGNLSDLKFVMSNGTGTIIMDNITITQYIPIVTTQPATTITACTGTSVSFTAAASGLPTPTVKWQKNISSVWTDISGATSNTYSIALPVVGDAGQYRALYTNSEGSTASNTSTITAVNPGSVGGSVTADATVCSGTNGGTLTLAGYTGTITKWQSSTNGGGSWSDISSTSTTRSYTNLTQTTLYRAVIQNGSCPTANSSAATITVNPITAITTQPANTSSCEGANATLTLVAAGGSLTYKWQDNSSGSFVDISGANAASLSLTGVSASMNGRQYKCIVSGNCGNATSNTVTLTVNPPSIGGTVTSNASVCSGTNSGTLTLSGHTGNVTKWQSSTNGGSSWSDISSTSTTRNYSNLTQTTLFRAVVQLGSCATANSSPATITVVALPVAYSVTGGGGFCSGGTGVAIGLSNSQVGTNYQLIRSGSTIGSPVAGTGAALTFPNQSVLGTYTVSATNATLGCASNMTGNAVLYSITAPGAPTVNPLSSTVLLGGIQAISATAQASTGTFGTGTSTNNSTSYPAPLGTYYGGARHQILILASELSAQGLTAGDLIKDLSFNVTNTNNAHAMINYTMSIGNTSLTALTSTFVTGLTQVYYSPSYAAVTGLNSFNFSTPFEWNGTSNIIIETVFNNNYLGTSTNPNCSSTYSTTSFTSVNYSREDNAGAGNGPILALSSENTSKRRPNMILGFGKTTAINWTPLTGLYTNPAATIAYSGTNATTVYAKPSSTTTYLVNAKGQGACPSASSVSAVVNVVTTPPNCVTAAVSGSACITSTSLNWSAASNFPQGYYLYFGTDNPPSNMIYQQDLGLATSVNLPVLLGNTTYYYQIAPYNSNGENTACAIGSFVSGASQNQSPTQSVNSYTETIDNGVTPPALPCGMTLSNENFPQDAFTWYSSTVAPHSGMRHLRIDKNTNNTTAKDDWFYSAPMNLSAGKLYRIYFWTRASNASKTESFELYLSNSPDAATMQTTSAIFMGNTNLLTYRLDSSADITVPVSGIYYYGFHANSAAATASLYVDDIQVREILVTGLNAISCTTIPSMANQLFCSPVYGAQDYKYRIENLSTSFSFEYQRNLAIPDFRLIWAPGVLYGLTYDVAVSYKKNNVWSPYGASCPVTIGPFPMTSLRPAFCGTSISNQNAQIFIDSIAGANDYEYRIVNNTLGYDHTWARGNSLTDYRLSWAYQYSPVLVQNLPYGYTYDLQVRALVGKTGPANGNLPGEYGPFGSVCQLTLSGAPQTQLKPGSCGITLNSLTDQIFCIPVPGAADYEYHIENAALGYSKNVIRNTASNDFRLSWVANSITQGLRFGTTYDITVRAKVGGVWLNFGPMCQITTPAHPMTKLQTAYCAYTLPTFQTTVYSDPIAGATNYKYHITGPNGYDRVIERNAPSTDFKFSWTLLCCGQQNMLPNSSYQVEVSTYAGGLWSAYGAICTITTGASVPRYAALENAGPEMEETNGLSLVVYPNPVATNSSFSIELTKGESDNEKIAVAIFDVLGKLVYASEIQLNQDSKLVLQPEVHLAAGVYSIEIRQNSTSIREKLVVE